MNETMELICVKSHAQDIRWNWEWPRWFQIGNVKAIVNNLKRCPTHLCTNLCISTNKQFPFGENWEAKNNRIYMYVCKSEITFDAFATSLFSFSVTNQVFLGREYISSLCAIKFSACMHHRSAPINVKLEQKSS